MRRDVSRVRWWIAPFARWMLRREARALAALTAAGGSDDGSAGAGAGACVPRLVALRRDSLLRSWLEGLPMQKARPSDPEFYRRARRLLAALSRAGVAHNDTAKEQNWLVLDDGGPALVDFQLAWISRRAAGAGRGAAARTGARAGRRGRFLRLLAREDLRHLLKHKRTYCPQALTAREIALLARPSPAARLLRAGPKRLYSLVTRRILRWSDDEGRA